MLTHSVFVLTMFNLFRWFYVINNLTVCKIVFVVYLYQA